ncbi:MAG: Hsp20/alpha crystallin family protein [Clostridia bacterium]|nr:Hsp20/alpha crystallin family protein [Clostridiales bacterium]MBQ2976051.1 Hsp20/alpha crystallin family protein [Clostridia bacterium]MBQ6805479.1 Hsp20/alpha crystallin family protein [Clostridia bacterium]
MYYTMIPRRPRHDLSHVPFHRSPSLFDDHFFRSFFNMNDMMGDIGFRVDIHEENDHYLLEAELPGVSQDQINLTVDHDSLVISADMRSERKDEKAYYSERRIGHVSRAFNLDGIDKENIRADYKNGILSVILPKEKPCESCGQRRIPIGCGDQQKIEE